MFSFIKFYFTKRNYDVYHIHAASYGSTFRKGWYVHAAKKWGKKVILHIHGAEYMLFYEKSNQKDKIVSILKEADDKTRCSMRFIRDDDLKVAFITMLNKLIFGHKFILRPYLKALQSTSGDEGIKRIQHLEQMLEQNTEQRETLTKLMAQGYIDQILFNQENNALLAQADGFRADIQAINSSMTGDTSKVMETEKLLHFAERGSMLAEFDDLLFTKFVDSVRVVSRQQVSFVLKCGLTFKERIGE